MPLRSWSMAAASTVAAIAAVVAIAAGGTTAACSSFSSEGTSPDLASEAGSDACADGSCVSLDGCAGKILYVRPNGDDANNGCDSALPKKTIGSAISTLRILSRVDFEVRVCKGEYRENGLTLDFPVKLFGGYECSTGIREASYGYPTFGAANESVLAVTDGGNATSTITATLVGKPVDAVVVDGLRIRAPSHSTLHTTAVNVAVGASATFSNDVIEGASTGARTTGVFLDRGAAVELTHDRITGGGGGAPQVAGQRLVGSTAVYADQTGPLKVHENFIQGGSGKAPDNAGSVGVFITGDSATKTASITGNHIHGGTGAGLEVSSVGAFIGGVPVDVEGNMVLGGDGTCTSKTLCAAMGMLVFSAQRTRVAGNRIYGGSLSQTTGVLQFTGLELRATKNAEVTNNFVHGGNAASVGPAAQSISTAVRLEGGSSSAVRYNTLFAGSRDADDIGTALLVAGGHVGAVAENNLFVGLRSSSSSGLNAACGTLATLDNNAFFDLPVLAVGRSRLPPCSLDIKDPRTTLAELPLFIAPMAANNIRIAGACSGTEGACSAPAGCNAPSGCRSAVFADFDEVTGGAGNVFDLAKRGPRLTGAATCVLADGGKVIGSITKDFFGVTRTAPTSVGAHELAICP